MFCFPGSGLLGCVALGPVLSVSLNPIFKIVSFWALVVSCEGHSVLYRCFLLTHKYATYENKKYNLESCY